MDWTAWGTWYTDSEDTTIKHIEHEGSVDESCTDTDNGVTDSFGDSCADYSSNPSWCNSFDTDTFISGEMCCACGGGSYSDDTSDDDTSTDGIWYHIDGSTGTWTVTTEGESGEWSRDDNTDSGSWSYDDDTTTIGTW
jgi:hypothetical protein